MKVILVLATILHLGWLQEAPEPFQVPDICTEMGPDQGTCGDYNVRWFFNPDDGQCKQFMYSGCGGNENNFKTLEDCEKMCKGRVRVDEQPEPASGEDQDAAREAPSNVGEQVQELRPEANEPVRETAMTDEEEPDSRDAEDDTGGDEDDLDDDGEDDELINKYLNVGDDLNVEDNQILKEAMAKFDVSVLKEETVEEDEDTDMEEHWDPEQQQQQQQQQEELQEELQLRQEERNVQEHEEQLENKREEEMMHLGAIDNREHQIQEEHREQLPQEQGIGVQEHEEQTKNIEGEQMTHIEENGDIEQQPPQQQQQEQQPPQEFQDHPQQEQQPEHDDDAVQMDEENNKQRNTENEETNDNGTAADDDDDHHDDDDDDDGFMEDNGKDVETFFDELPTDMGPEDREMLLEGVAKFGATLLKAPEDIDDDMEIVPYGDEEAGQPNEEKDVPNDVEEARRELEDAHRDLQEAHSDISDIGVAGREAPMTSSNEKSLDGKTPDGERAQRFRTGGARNVHPAPMNNPVLPGMPTQSPTKKITFMMPLLSFLNKRVPIAPTASPLHRSPMMMMMERSNPRRRLSPSSAFSGREAVTAIRRTSIGMKTRREPTRPDSERTDEEARPPFSPLRYMIMRAMFKPMSRDLRSGSSRPSQTKAMPSRVRILFPWLQPAKPASFQKQQPVPKLPIIRAPVDRSKMPLNRGFSPFREADTLEDNPQRVRGQSIFAPKIVRKSEFESFSHDNKHLNNVSPNNKFTLLQVFVNKHNGRQYFDDPSRRTRQSMAQTNNNNTLPQTRLSPEPFNQAAKSFQPMMYPVRTSPYQPYPVSSFWPEQIPQMPHHYHPYSMSRGYPSQFARVPMPFGPSDSLGLPYNPRPVEVRPLPRRPIEVRPLLVTHRRNEAHAEGTKSRHCCLMPLAPGRCKSYQTKWYYNRDSGKCEIFYYTGCAGNGNNFETWEECAATCLETSPAPRSTVPPHIMSRLSTPEESLEQEERQEEEEEEDKRPETIIITSTRFPENDAEEKQAMEEAKTVAPSVDQPISSTTERFEPVEKDDNDEESDNEVLKEHQVVISEASLMSTHYIMLLAVITTVALAIIVLVSISSVHLCRKMRANKKEKILEAVIKQQLSAETPNIVYTTKPPSVEQTDKSQV